MSICDNESALSFGSKPLSVTWNVVRGDTASLKLYFLEKDEVTPIDMSGWTFAASTYDLKGNALDELTVNVGVGFVEIVAPSVITQTWGIGYKNGIIAELAFDLEITISADNRVWTPIIGTIAVIPDISGSGL